MIKNIIVNLLSKTSIVVNSGVTHVHLEHPSDMTHGDYSTNIALVLSKSAGVSPREIAENLKQEIEKDLPKEIERVEVAGAGFLNFFLSKDFLNHSINTILKEGKDFGKGESFQGKKVLVEYTDPNPFKVFHIGHLMQNAIGESLTRLAEFAGADVKRLCYQGDVGLHVAKTIWGMIQARVAFPQDGDSLTDKIKFMGNAYVVGNLAYTDDPKAKEEIKEINKKVYERSDPEINIYYDKGKKWSLEHFEEIYKKLGTKFDEYFFESEMAGPGKELVLEFLKKGIFKESDGAIIFPGEEHGLHTRVFINSEGLPTYEAKDLGLFFAKSNRYEYDLSVYTTASEQSDYFKVLFSAIGMIDKSFKEKAVHVPHGLLRFSDGKMSSRKGNIISGEDLIKDMEVKAMDKMGEREMDESLKREVSEIVAVSAIKYSILKQSPGKDIVFDPEKSLSFEGDSGPYLLYALVRTNSILRKAKEAGLTGEKFEEGNYKLQKMLYRFPEIVERAWLEKSPQLVADFLQEVAHEFSAFYANEKIVDTDDLKNSQSKVALTRAFREVLKTGLFLLGIKEVERM
ncbi:MAG: arginyl-tRNA synthetase [Patescibacteria group bacterium]|jgi:arginyl-tRNA synthetase|nr:arginyl-tRNA synthetase [Patescibacteria group bacterium]